MLNRKIFCKSGLWFAKCLAIYHNIILSLSQDQLTIATCDVLIFS